MRYIFLAAAALWLGCATQPQPRRFTIWTVDHFAYSGESEQYRRRPPCSAAEVAIDGLCWAPSPLTPPCLQLDIECDGRCCAPTYDDSDRGDH